MKMGFLQPLLDFGAVKNSLSCYQNNIQTPILMNHNLPPFLRQCYFFPFSKKCIRRTVQKLADFDSSVILSFLSIYHSFYLMVFHQSSSLYLLLISLFTLYCIFFSPFAFFLFSFFFYLNNYISPALFLIMKFTTKVPCL